MFGLITPMIRGDLCGSSPTLTACTLTVNDNGCPSGTDYVVTWTYSGNKSMFKLDIWRKTSSGGSFAFWQRADLDDANKTETIEEASDGGGVPATVFRDFQGRIVPTISAGGSHAGCSNADATQDSRTLAPCVE
jgi:hypothetical protein